MSIDFTPGIINTYNGDIYNRTTNTDDVKTPDTPKWPCDNREEQHPINSTFSGEGYNPEQFDLAQQQLQQINACHTNTTYTNADYSKVVAQLVSLINNIETISSTPITQQTQSILNQIHNIRYEKDKDSVCQIIVVVNPEPNNPIITKILVEEGIPERFSVQTVSSDNKNFAGQRADLPTDIRDIQSLYLKMAKLYIEHSENENRMEALAGCDFIDFNMTGQDMSRLVLNLSKFYFEDLLNINFTDANLFNTIFSHKENPIPKLHEYEQHLDKQINGLFSTLLTINDNSLRAKAEIASRIIDFLEAKVVNLSFDDILKYKQEFKKICYKQLQEFTTPSLYNKIQKWATMSKNEFIAFHYETLQPEKISYPFYLKRDLPNEKDINYGVEIEIPSGKRIRLSNHYQNITP
ncbi:hypothetical protein RQW94_19915 [Shigella flexneri]|uniref:hypothetical protein n=1 Tax=Shigella flexneri TaxID=623 RepID=UPI0028E0A805|nr:hypothetical protein [Shigella flexneri]MDT9385319.1 hypothetical protein [Shigella flexneri]MDT9389666.1 hypothetical protein [Shigella flexneri]MDT9393914.1 hypothetical protein [Shigella flexneri]MDT9398194.1 hypothetical protein [Shigella flexneri]MDT9407137.1 hypothetical protein [Shigella flexneri]